MSENGEGMRITVHRLPTGRVHLAVLDRDPARPQIQPPTPDGVSGRGLLPVDECTDLAPGVGRPVPALIVWDLHMVVSCAVCPVTCTRC